MQEIILRKSRHGEIIVIFPYEIDEEDGKNMVVVFSKKKTRHTFKDYQKVMDNSEPIEEGSEVARWVLSELHWKFGYINLTPIKERNYEKYMAIWTKSIMED